MSLPPSAKDILSDIEFEILQGYVSKDDLGPALQAVRQFQNQARAELFRGMKATDARRESLSRLMQINDMLLTLLQQMALNFQALRAEITRLRQMPEQTFSPAREARPASPRPDIMGEGTAMVQPLVQADFPTMGMRSPDEIAHVLRDDAIQVELQARPIHIPVIGWLLTKLRIFYQRPALFYTQLLSTRQAPVNRVLGDRILYLEGIVQMQQQQIEALSARISARSEEAQDASGH